MELFERIISDRALFAILCGTCSENQMAVVFSDKLLKNDEIDDEKVLILKPDSYYSTANFFEPPPAVDCLILVKCDQQNHYDLYLVELRNVSRGTLGLKFKEISPKFDTILNQFFTDFEAVFANAQFGKTQLLLITNPYRSQNEHEFKSRFSGAFLDAYASQRLSFQNKKFPIQPVYPHKTHIHPC